MDKVLTFLLQNGLTLIFGVTTLILTIITIKYRRLTYLATVKKNVTVSKNIDIYYSKEPLLEALKEMYNKASSNSEIWGQCVSCSSYTDDINSVVVDKAKKGVKYRIILNEGTGSGLYELFSVINTAKVKFEKSVKFRIHGLDNKEIIIGFSSIQGTRAIHIKDKDFTEVILNYFNNKWNNLR